MKINRFEDIESWKEARQLTRNVYSLSTIHKFSKDFGLRDQIQRAAVSIMSNIAEGFDGGSHKVFATFLTYSYRSASEVQSLLYVALDSQYIDQVAFQTNFDHVGKIKRLIGGMIKYLRNTN